MKRWPSRYNGPTDATTFDLSFESITDRVVKRFFADHAGKTVSLQQGGTRWEGRLPRVRLVTRHAVKADEEERGMNPRARSARLRAAERV